MEDMIARGQLKMDAMDLGKKSAVEKELEVLKTSMLDTVSMLSVVASRSYVLQDPHEAGVSYSPVLSRLVPGGREIH